MSIEIIVSYLGTAVTRIVMFRFPVNGCWGKEHDAGKATHLAHTSTCADDDNTPAFQYLPIF